MKKGTHIFALGGLDEIGKNTYVVETQKSLIVVDVGIKFANSTLLGFDALIANFNYLKENESKIEAIVVTHGHEDHIGAIPHYLRNVKIKKIITFKLTAELIKKRLSEYKDIQVPEIVVFEENQKFTLGDIEVEFYRVCHSIPDSFGVVFNTPDGRIVSTGDFRFDFATKGDSTDLTRLMSLTNKGVDLLLCESTSAEVPGFSESEKYIIKNIETLIKNAKGRIFLSTFASNLSRIEQLLKYALTLDKKILILGRSMENNIKISRKLGYLKMSDTNIIESKDLPNYQDNEILVILTGSQGEPKAALNSIVKDNHPKIKLKPSDTIILSSNPIPGNFAQVEDMLNYLHKSGVIVYENTPDFKIHASGHATRSELQLMIKAVNPKFLFPIHGEYKMLKTLKKNAVDAGFNPDNVIIAKNGQKLQLLNNKVTLTDELVDTEPFYINGQELNKDSKKLLSNRILLSKEGFILLMILYDSKKNEIFWCNISTRGSFYAKDAIFAIKKINTMLKNELNDYLKETKLSFNDEKFYSHTESICSNLIWKFMKKSPLIKINIWNYNQLSQLANEKNYIEIQKQTLSDVDDNEWLIQNNNDINPKNEIE